MAEDSGGNSNSMVMIALIVGGLAAAGGLYLAFGDGGFMHTTSSPSVTIRVPAPAAAPATSPPAGSTTTTTMPPAPAPAPSGN